MFQLTPQQIGKMGDHPAAQHFTLSEDGTRIRAAQGHSVEIDLDIAPMALPAMLFHGTAAATVAAIMAEGLKPGRRQKVYLSLDEETAVKATAAR